MKLFVQDNDMGNGFGGYREATDAEISTAERSFIPTATATIHEMRTITAMLQSASDQDAPPQAVTLDGEAYMVAMAILRTNNSPEALKAVILLEEGLMDFIMEGGK